MPVPAAGGMCTVPGWIHCSGRRSSWGQSRALRGLAGPEWGCSPALEAPTGCSPALLLFLSRRDPVTFVQPLGLACAVSSPWDGDALPPPLLGWQVRLTAGSAQVSLAERPDHGVESPGVCVASVTALLDDSGFIHSSLWKLIFFPV